MLGLFTDFGAADLYVGQLHVKAAALAPAIPLFDIAHDVACYNVTAAAHLLHAMMVKLPELSGWLAVIDPGVGSARAIVAAQLDGKWVVGPDNGLLTVAAARSHSVQLFRSDWQPAGCSGTFHGRDIFLPLVLQLLQGQGHGKLIPLEKLSSDLGAADLAQVIYIDHYGSLFSGIRAGNLPSDSVIHFNGRAIAHADTFDSVATGTLFWYGNSAGLVEIACNQGSAAQVLAAAVGDALILR